MNNKWYSEKRNGGVYYKKAETKASLRICSHCKRKLNSSFLPKKKKKVKKKKKKEKEHN